VFSPVHFSHGGIINNIYNISCGEMV
jgi:hypothetical protein